MEIEREVDHLSMELANIDLLRSAPDMQEEWRAGSVCASAAEEICTGCEGVMARIASELDGDPANVASCRRGMDGYSTRVGNNPGLMANMKEPAMTDPPSLEVIGATLRTVQADQRLLRSEVESVCREIRGLNEHVASIEARLDTRFDQMQSEVVRLMDKATSSQLV